MSGLWGSLGNVLVNVVEILQELNATLVQENTLTGTLVQEESLTGTLVCRNG